ncbi:MAG: acetolactate synthase AlsS [Phycisphaerae bacterium]|nr:acetolactate synthase AlsS [Phycisphaerae bacterium]MAT81470.1 acetolactate synthase AlsS [Phycisphaerae bacterium]
MFKKNFSGMNAAELVVRCLEAQKVSHVFGIPGAKVDPLMEALADGTPEFVVCRHEQNAAFIAGGIGRMTGRPGVCLTTSGPGVSNLATGLITATAEGHPVVALSGSVPSALENLDTHQTLDNVSLMRPVTKHAVSVRSADSVVSTMANAFRASMAPRPGAAFVSLPYDIMLEEAGGRPVSTHAVPLSGPADHEGVLELAQRISKASLPVLLIGRGVSSPHATEALRALLGAHPMPVVGTFEAAGAIPKELVHCFLGRVGLFKNQTGDQLLDRSDLIIALGFDEIEYDPELWCNEDTADIIHVSPLAAQIREQYHPAMELIGDIGSTLVQLANELGGAHSSMENDYVRGLVGQYREFVDCGGGHDKSGPVHPLRFIHDLHHVVDDETTVTCDIGSVYIWMSRYFLAYEPNRLLFSNGQQTLGVALPWAMAASLVRPGEKVISMSGDGGFLFSAMELETAVRLKNNFVHVVWRDGTYDMVGIQQQLKYDRRFGDRFGEPDIVKFAEAFGASGMRISAPGDIIPVLREALDTPGPVLVDMPVDYSDNMKLCEAVRTERQH